MRRPAWPVFPGPGTAFLAATLTLLTLFCACRSARNDVMAPGIVPRGRPFQTGIASWYGPGFHGRLTANGERYDMNEISAAHKKLPFGTIVRVHNRDNGQVLDVRINDRGPFIRGRVIDLSKKAAEELGMLRAGIAKVDLYLLAEPPAEADRKRRGPTQRAGQYVVQLGAFRDRDRALDLKLELGEVYPDIAIDFDGVWHRVRIGPYQSRRTAVEVMKDVERRGHRGVVIQP